MDKQVLGVMEIEIVRPGYTFDSFAWHHVLQCWPYWNCGALMRSYMPHHIHVDGINGSAELHRLLMCANVLWRVMPSKGKTGLYSSSKIWTSISCLSRGSVLTIKLPRLLEAITLSTPIYVSPCLQSQFRLALSGNCIKFSKAKHLSGFKPRYPICILVHLLIIWCNIEEDTKSIQ